MVFVDVVPRRALCLTVCLDGRVRILGGLCAENKYRVFLCVCECLLGVKDFNAPSDQSAGWASLNSYVHWAGEDSGEGNREHGSTNGDVFFRRVFWCCESLR